MTDDVGAARRSRPPLGLWVSLIALVVTVILAVVHLTAREGSAGTARVPGGPAGIPHARATPVAEGAGRPRVGSVDAGVSAIPHPTPLLEQRPSWLPASGANGDEAELARLRSQLAAAREEGDRPRVALIERFIARAEAEQQSVSSTDENHSVKSEGLREAD